MTIDTQELTRGLLYSHHRANANTAAVHEAHTTVQAVVELLEERGLLSHDALEARKQSAAEPLRQKYIKNGMSVALQQSESSKYDFAGETKIDCEARLHLCKASCCRLGFALSGEDVQENIVKWDLGRPYTIAQDESGYCTHCDGKTRRCSVYEYRPVVCRGYDCRKDKRIWSDFEKRIINPQLHDPDWPGCIQTDEADATAASDDKGTEAAQPKNETNGTTPVTNGNSGGFRRARLPMLRVQRSAALRAIDAAPDQVATANGNEASTDSVAGSRRTDWIGRMRRHWRQKAGLDVLHPKHLQEINERLHEFEQAIETATDGPTVFTTSRGIRIAASRIVDCGDRLSHFSVSREGRALDETAAAMLGQFIARNISSGGEPELIAAGGGVFHLLIRPVTDEISGG